MALALEGEGRVARDHEAVADAREVGGEVLGDAVGEIILARIAGEVSERQHDDGEMRGFSRRRGGRDDRRGAVSDEEIPGAAHDYDERDHPGDQQQERRARFRLGQLLGRFRLCHRLRLGGDAHLQRIDPDRSFDVLELRRAEIGDRHIEPAAHLAIGVLGETDRAGRGDPFQSRGDVDAVAHQIAVGLLDDVAQMNADPELDAALRRQAGVALDEAVLDLDRAAHRVDHAAEFDERCRRRCA